jgi:flagellar basal body-associated protein FliL
MEVVKEAVKKYQWKKGENFGKVVEVLEQDDKFTKFTDGSQIFNNVINEFLEEVIGDKLPFPGADSLNMLAMGEIQPNVKKITTKTKQEPIIEISPLEELVGKLSKKNIEPLETVINLNIPNRQIFNMLIESADEDRDNLIETIAKVAVSQIEINKLQEYLKEEVTTFINKYYNE